jgi:mannobiose 2-epimerase
MSELHVIAEEMKEHLLGTILPFWMNLKDEENGGFYGWVGYDLKTDPKAEKGCILNSRITWFFANVCLLYKGGLLTEDDFAKHGYSVEDVKACAKHGYDFLQGKCIDRENGGIFWSLNYDGTPADTTKHTYNQAFCIYALSSYYDAFRDDSALELAMELVQIIEKKCRDDIGYLEARTITFEPESNEKLSENGVMADKTMNTLLHVFEAYTELYRVTKDALIGDRLAWMMDLFAEKIYNPELHRQEVFFDREYNTILDLHSYGHDIETAWLMDRGTEVLGREEYVEKMSPITRDLTAQIYKVAFDGHSLANECDRGVVNVHRIWWVQAESAVGFANGYQKTPEHTEYLEAAKAQWEFIKEHVFDKRKGSEWFWEVDPEGKPYPDRPIVEPWKCPYHNGRMCMEFIRREEK